MNTNLIYFLAFALFFVSMFLLLNWSIPKVSLKFVKTLHINDASKKIEHLIEKSKQKKVKIYKRVKAYQEKKRKSSLQLFLSDVRLAIAFQRRANALGRLIYLSLIFFAIGSIFSAMLNNVALIPSAGILFASFPLIYTIFRHNKRKQELNLELETTLSVITTSYFRSNNIVLSVKENIDYINEPLKRIFLQFLLNVDYIYSDTKKCLYDLKYELDSPIFHEWIDILITCIDDSSLKPTLLPTVNKLSDMRIVGNELDTLVYAPLKEFVLVMIFYVSCIPFTFFINKGWWNTLTNTVVGKIYLSVSFFIVLFSLIKVIGFTRPVEYKR